VKVYFIGAGPGDAELLTVKAKRLIETCAYCIYAGSLISEEIVGLLPEKARRFNSAELDLDEITELFLKARDESVDIIRLHSGDPTIYSAIREQMRKLDELGIEYETVPGISSFQAAAAALNLELTVPNSVQTIILTRTAGRTPVPPEQELDQLGKTRATLCIFLSVQRMANVVEKLIPHYGGDCPVAVVYRASWPDQLIVRGNLSDIARKTESEGITKTAIIVVGWALAPEKQQSKLYDPTFSHGFRKAK
jgi:precorrin-4/cobalt-precorrin-4 C11-methyltransferase